MVDDLYFGVKLIAVTPFEVSTGSYLFVVELSETYTFYCATIFLYSLKAYGFNKITAKNVGQLLIYNISFYNIKSESY